MKDKKALNIYYQKNSQYRTIHCDGALGGRTPLNEFNINFYSTRNVIPQVVEYELKDNGGLGEIKSSVGKNGVVREIEFGVYMSESTAKDIYEFLKKQFENE